MMYKRYVNQERYNTFLINIDVLHMCFTQEKGKYEITVGGLKAAEDLADYWGDITTKYPSVIGIIDPMRRVVSA